MQLWIVVNTFDKLMMITGNDTLLSTSPRREDPTESAPDADPRTECSSGGASGALSLECGRVCQSVGQQVAGREVAREELLAHAQGLGC